MQLCFVVSLSARRARAGVPGRRQAPRNVALLTAVATSAALAVAVIYLPFAHGVFATVSLGPLEALTAILLALLPLAAAEAAKTVMRAEAPDATALVRSRLRHASTGVR